MYTVHMKRVSATEARKNWFRLLDEVVEGETILIEREGARLILQLAETHDREERAPDYQGLIRARDVDTADRWGWEWNGSPDGLVPKLHEPES
jgi:antitoxin (DNA-binding transcriptional repressor) of toxin-antitoxin stability system